MIEHTIFIHKVMDIALLLRYWRSVMGNDAAVVVLVARKSFFFAIRAQTGVIESVG